MKYYNVYYKGVKLNNRPVTEEEKINIQNSQEIHKRNSITNRLEKIDTANLRYVKTLII